MACCWGECLPRVTYRMRHVSRGVWMEVFRDGVRGCARRAVTRRRALGVQISGTSVILAQDLSPSSLTDIEHPGA